MTDERFVLQQTNKERKVTARSARYRKCGSKSHKVGLPSDNMTSAQKRRLNGEVYAMNLNKPMTIDELRAMPYRMQREYLDHLINHRGFPATWVARMLGIAPATLTSRMFKLAITNQRKGRRVSRKVKDEFAEFIGAQVVPSTPDPVSLPAVDTPDEPACDPAPVPAPVPAPDLDTAVVDSLSMTATGQPVACFAAIIRHLSAGSTYTITITAKEVNDDD